MMNRSESTSKLPNIKVGGAFPTPNYTTAHDRNMYNHRVNELEIRNWAQKNLLMRDFANTVAHWSYPSGIPCPRAVVF